MAYDYSSSLLIAETATGIPTPVFWDTHTSIYNAGTPVTVITGSPGSGKTFAGQIITAQSALKGKTTIVIDYKGDMLKVAPLEDELGVPVTIWNLGDDSQKGVLDPFNLTDDPKIQLSLALDFINIVAGGLTKEENHAIYPILQDVSSTVDPNMVRVITALRSSQNPIARHIGQDLEAIRGLNYGQLCFFDGRRRKKAPPSVNSNGLTIATLATMRLPESPEEAKDTSWGRLSSGILYLLMDYIRRALSSQDATVPKTLIIDEAWAILSTKAGLEIVKAVALLGRSKNLAMVLITQSPEHLKEANIKNTIATRFSFRTSKEDAQTLVNETNLPEGEGFEQMVAELPQHTCLMSDHKGDFGIIKFSAWREDWLKVFSTNPLDAMRERRAARSRRLK